MKTPFKKDQPEEEAIEEREDIVPESLEAFFAQNMRQENLEQEVAISDRFLGKDGKPAKWKIRALSDVERDAIQRECMVTKAVRKNGKLRTVQELDAIKFANMLRARAVVHPDLNNQELQDSYGVRCAEDLLGVMLTSNEGALLLEAVNAIGAPDNDELEEEAKN